MSRTETVVPFPPRRVLFVDDSEERFHRFIEVVRPYPLYETSFAPTVELACNLALDGLEIYDEVWLDHDAGVDTSDVSFYPVACILAAGRYAGQVYVHSSNPDGANRMMRKLRDYGVKAKKPDGTILGTIWAKQTEGSGE